MRLRAAWEAGCRRVSGEIALFRSLLPPAMPDLSPETVGNWPVRRGEWVATPDAFPGASPSRHTSRPFDLALSLFLYEGDVREGIRAAKYGGRSDVARTLARRLFEAIRGDWADRIPDGFCPTIVPVPIRPWKYFRRGYNFPALVALSLVRLCGWPCDPLLLRRTGERRPQAGLPISVRERNVRGAFAARRGARAPAHVLLVDDVYTSGATAAACSRTLKMAGAEHIVVLTVARAVF